MSRATRRSPTGRARATTRRGLRVEAEARPSGGNPILLFTGLALLLILALGLAVSWGAGSAGRAVETRAVEVRSQPTSSKPVEDFEENYESGYSDN